MAAGQSEEQAPGTLSPLWIFALVVAGWAVLQVIAPPSDARRSR